METTSSVFAQQCAKCLHTDERILIRVPNLNFSTPFDILPLEQHSIWTLTYKRAFQPGKMNKMGLEANFRKKMRKNERNRKWNEENELD